MRGLNLELKSYGISDIGLGRSSNEDVWAGMPQYSFFVLADGMGGHKAGEVAAHEAVTSLCHSIQSLFASPISAKHSPEEMSVNLEEAILNANSTVYHLSGQEEEFSGMGTTLCCFLLHETSLIYAHVGDSRIYRFREKLEPLTQDHSLRAELIARGELEKEKAHEFPRKNIITRAIGTHPIVLPEIRRTTVLPGDLYFLCSDGLTDYVSDDEITYTITKASSLEEATQRLVQAAIAKGGNDNITIVMTQVQHAE